MVLLLVYLLQGPSLLFSRHLGAGAFYAVIPFPIMVWSAAVLRLLGMAAIAVAGTRFWQDLTSVGEGRPDFRAFTQALRDAASL